jgi:hypothetical protein
MTGVTPKTTIVAPISANVGDGDENIFREGDAINTHHSLIW